MVYLGLRSREGPRTKTCEILYARTPLYPGSEVYILKHLFGPVCIHRQKYLYLYIYIYTHTYWAIWSARAVWSLTSTFVYMYIYVYVCVYMYMNPGAQVPKQCLHYIIYIAILQRDLFARPLGTHVYVSIYTHRYIFEA